MAKDWGYLNTVPSIRLPRQVPTRFRFLSVEECLLVEEASTQYWRPMIHFARKTGLRIGEITPCDWEQINFDNATVNVDRAVWRKRLDTPKGGFSRVVDLSRDTVCMLRALWLQHGRPSRGLVFPSKVGRIRQETKADQGLRRSARRAGIEPFGWHVLRHTFASHLVKTGAPIPVVQALLGHTDIQLTMRYAHLSPGQTANAVQRLDLESDRDSSGHYLGIGRTEAQPKARKSE